jgi:flagellar biosynthetic protein FliP
VKRLLARGLLLASVVIAVPLVVAPSATAAAPARAAAAAVPAAPGDPADAATKPVTPGVTPVKPVTPAAPANTGSVTVRLDKIGNKPSQPVVIILLMTVLAIAPALLVLGTSFTKIIVVLSLTRNALGVPNIPPNQVLAGLALFLSLFVMSPVLSKVNSDGIQPYLKGEKSQSEAATDGVQPLRTFMLKQTKGPELQNMIEMSKQEKPKKPADVPLTTLIPAFVLSELKAAFIIGFVIFVPFLVIDLVVSSSLMSMGMMMLPPVLISLPFKLLLFVMIDGWDLITRALVTSYS